MLLMWITSERMSIDKFSCDDEVPLSCQIVFIFYLSLLSTSHLPVSLT